MYAAMHCSKSLNSISFSTEIHNSIETLDGRNLSLMYHVFFFSVHDLRVKPYVVTNVPEAVRNPTVI
jgi:hypothetical protein